MTSCELDPGYGVRNFKYLNVLENFICTYICTSEFFYPWYCKSLLGKHDFVSGILGLWSSISI